MCATPRRGRKSIWEQRITWHTTIRQDTNSVLIEIAKEKKMPLKRVLETLIKESETFKKKFEEMKKEGYFEF